MLNNQTLLTYCSSFRYHLIAQDHQEIYLTIAEYGGAYLDYLNQSANPEAVRIDAMSSRHEDSFLVMKQFGPLDRHSRKQMEVLEPFIYALTKELGELDVEGFIR